MPPAFHFAGAGVLLGSGLENRSLLRSSRSAPAGACSVCGRSIELFDVIGAQFLHLAVADIGDDRLPQKSSRVNVNLSGQGPSILLRKTVLSLKSPTGAFIAPLRCANANLSGRGPSILLRKTVLSLKSPTGAFIAPLRFANANF